MRSSTSSSRRSRTSRSAPSTSRAKAMVRSRAIAEHGGQLMRQSAGGRYLPVFATEILYQNSLLAKKKDSKVSPINLKSVIIGKSLTDEFGSGRFLTRASTPQVTVSRTSCVLSLVRERILTSFHTSRLA